MPLGDIANFFERASPGKLKVLLSHSNTGILVARLKLLLFWTDACPKKFAIHESDGDCAAIVNGNVRQKEVFTLS